MKKIFVNMQEAAELEKKQYSTFRIYFYRNKDNFDYKEEKTQNNAVKYLINLASLSDDAQDRYIKEKTQEVKGSDVVIANLDVNKVPWYVSCDFDSYYIKNKAEYNKAIALAKEIEMLISSNERDRVAYVESMAGQLDISSRSLYRYMNEYSEACGWATKIETDTRLDYSYFRILSLCRKPRTKETFPSISEEVKQLICNIWFNPEFAKNQGTIEMLDTALRDMTDKKYLEVPSYRTIARYINHIMSDPKNESARFLSANGTIEWRNKKMLKGMRDSTSVKVMEVIHGDGHTFDCWVQYTHPNGKITAVKPTLVAWLDTRTRAVVGDVVCLNSNSQVIKESILKTIYGSPGGVPRALLIDNGKDFTSGENIGQDRYIRQMVNNPDEDLQGFYGSVGIEIWHRAQVKQPWVKNIERFFSTVCMQFTKWFNSYTGTLTSSKTSHKINKDVKKMLERGELLTMEEFYDKWTEFKEKYHMKEHSGLKKAKERWTTPLELFKNCDDRYEKALPTRELAAIMLMKRDIASVTSQGIRKFGTIYSDYELRDYAGEKVVVRYNNSDLTKLYVYDINTEKLLCEATPLEALEYFPTSEAEIDKVAEHNRKQNRHRKDTDNIRKEMLTPYENLVSQEDHRTIVGKVDLMIGKKRDTAKIIALPKEKVYRNNREEKREDSEYIMEAGRKAALRMMKTNLGG